MKIQLRKLPLATIVLAIIFAIGLILFINAYSKKEAFSEFTLWGSKETVIGSQNKDTDNDGLKDWEEDLYKTDYLNPDTDFDGYLDGEEINSGHNPLVKGPNDNQVFYPLPVGDKYNITNKIFFGIDSVLESYILQKDQYVKDHPEITSPEEFLAQTSSTTLNELLTRAILSNNANWLDQAEQILAQMPEVFDIEISDNDIVISEENSQTAKTTHLNALSAYFNSENSFLQERNFILLKDSLINNDFEELDEIIKLNDTGIDGLVATPVPRALKDLHKEALKIAIVSRNIFVSTRGFDTDPVKAVIAINEINNILDQAKEFSKNLPI